MNNALAHKRTNRAFTLIEVAVSTVILALTVSLAMGAIASMTTTELRIRDTEKTNLLAIQKLHEILAVGNVASAPTSGTFTDYGEPNYSWTLEVAATGTDGLETVHVIVTRTNAKTTDASSQVAGLIFTSPNATTGSLGG